MRRLGLFSGILLSFSILLHLPASAQKRVALVIGINAYDNLGPDKQLKKAVNDARAMDAALRALGFEVIKDENPARSQFNRLWQRFLNRIEPGDTAAFFFSGHGVQIGGLNYLLPRDVPSTAEAEEKFLMSESLDVAPLLKELHERRPRVSLMILDACRNNPYQRPGGKSVGGDKGLARIDPPEGTFVMFAAGTGETALDRLSDGDEEPNSVYTRSLIPLMRQPGLTLQAMAVTVRDEVRSLAARINHRQTLPGAKAVRSLRSFTAQAAGARRTSRFLSRMWLCLKYPDR